MYAFRNMFLFTALICLAVIGCSSSSVSQRYNKPIVEENKSENSVRFTSENDSKKKSKVNKNNEVLYSNISNDFDDEPYEEVIIDTKEFVKNNKIPASLLSTLTNREKILFEVVSYLETPYEFGGESYSGIDCSAFTQNIFRKAVKIDLPRTAKKQFEIGVFSNTDLKFGDLVFFDTRKNAYPGHVGLYLGNDLFAHASSSKGVIVSSLKSSYYAERFIGARRLENFEK